MDFITCKESAKFLQCTRQMIYDLIKTKKVEHMRKGFKYFVSKNSLEEYIKNRWSRDRYFKENELSVKKAAILLGITPQQMYYLIYKGHVHYRRTGALYIIRQEDLEPWIQARRIIYQLRSNLKAIEMTTGVINPPERKRLKRLLG